MKRTLVLFAAIGLMLTPAAFADGKGKGKDRDQAPGLDWSAGPLAQRDEQGWGDQFSPGQARDAVKEGRTVPLSRIFQSLKREYGGYQLGADLYSREGGGAVGSGGMTGATSAALSATGSGALGPDEGASGASGADGGVCAGVRSGRSGLCIRYAGSSSRRCQRM